MTKTDGNNYIDHNYIGHNYIGHTYIGHNYMNHYNMMETDEMCDGIAISVFIPDLASWSVTDYHCGVSQINIEEGFGLLSWSAGRLSS